MTNIVANAQTYLLAGEVFKTERHPPRHGRRIPARLSQDRARSRPRSVSELWRYRTRALLHPGRQVAVGRRSSPGCSGSSHRGSLEKIEVSVGDVATIDTACRNRVAGRTSGLRRLLKQAPSSARATKPLPVDFEWYTGQGNGARGPMGTAGRVGGSRRCRCAGSLGPGPRPPPRRGTVPPPPPPRPYTAPL